MSYYIPHTDQDRARMLDVVGVNSLDALYDVVPREMMMDTLGIPEGLGEQGVAAKVSGIAAKNRVFSSIFRGAGAYHHYIPSIVRAVTGKEEFLTAYTPYQAEISQGVLQSIFEYQTMMCELTGMDVSNASVYDGATAAAEAVNMCVDKRRPVALVADTVKPMTLQTIRTYCEGADVELCVIPSIDGIIDQDELVKCLDARLGCLYMETPNFYGLIDECEEICDMVHAAGGKVILGVNPIAIALLKSAAELGADVAVGEGQPLGMPLSFGGPYLGFMTATQAMVRKLPGRIVGETTDADGNRAFVLTLQAREQHIRREKASSNICSNQALCAMTAAVYISAMGPNGLREVASQCHSKAVYLADKLSKIPGFERRHEGMFFHEFLTGCPIDPKQLEKALAEQGMLCGLPIGKDILWCATEMNTKEQIDALVCAIKEAVG